MKTTLIRNPENLSSLNHPDHPALYRPHDTVRSLEECPFPLETDSFRVLMFGDTTQGDGGTFALVEYVKSCGHAAQDRISFFENVEDFTHHGTEFKGADYSIRNWKSRIEFFRRGRCPVCEMFEHCRWAHFHAGERTASRKKTLERFRLLMNANFLNWPDFVSLEDFILAIQSPARRK